MGAQNNLYEEYSRETKLHADFSCKDIDYTEPIIGHRSLVLNIITTTLAILMFSILVYFFFSSTYELGPLYIFSLLAAILFCFFSLKSLLDRSREIKIDMEGITFNNNETIKWPDIKKISIRQRCYFLTKDNSAIIERYYIDIETIFSGKYSHRPGLHTYEITGLTLSATAIESYIELFKIRSTAF